LRRNQDLTWYEIVWVVAVCAVIVAGFLMFPHIDAPGKASWSSFPWLALGIIALAACELLRFCSSRDWRPLFRPGLCLAGVAAGFLLLGVTCVLLRVELRSLGMLLLYPVYIVPMLILVLDGRARKRCER